jgi:hypothetical protein
LAGIPILIFILGNSLIWVIRSRDSRAAWLTSLLTSVAALFSLLILLQYAPMGLEISSWGQISAQDQMIAIRLDASNDKLLIMILIWMVVRNLVEPTHDHGEFHTWQERINGNLGFVAALLILTAANVLTSILAWIILDLLTLGFHFRSGFSSLNSFVMNSQFSTGFLSSGLLIFAGALMLAEQGALVGDIVPVLVISAAGLRVFSPLISRLTISASEHVSPYGDIIGLVSVAAGFSLLLRFLPLFPFFSHSARLSIAGALLMILSLFWWFFYPRTPRWPGFTAGIFTFSLISLPILDPYAHFLPAIAVVALFGAASEILFVPMYVRWQRLLPLVVGILLVNLTTGVGMSFSGLWGGNPGTGAFSWETVVVLIGSVLFGAGLMNNTFGKIVEWPRVDVFSKTLYRLAIFGLVAGGLGLSINLRSSITLWDVIVFGFALILSMLLAWWARNRKKYPFEEKVLQVSRLIIDSIKAIVQVLLSLIVQVSGAIAGIFEGDAGMLWVFVVVQAVIIVIGSGLL